MTTEERALGAYLGLALGDALGATVEFMTPREIRSQFGLHDRIRGGGWLNLRPGQVTDDTTMSLALGEAILQADGIDPLAIAQSFDQWMRAKPVDIGHTVRRGLMYFRRTGDPCVPFNEQDAGNGAAMRVLPIAIATLHWPEAQVRAACRAQARVTHHNALSDAATETLALMIQSALHGASQTELLERHAAPLIAAHPVFAFQGGRSCGNPSGYVVDSFQAVFQSYFGTRNARDCLIDVVNRGGDADTTGAIAGILAGASYGLQSFPRSWRHALNPAIRQSCQEQARQLCAWAARHRVAPA